MKKLLNKNTSIFAFVIAMMTETSVSAQMAQQPVGMRYVGNQQYMGTRTTYMPNPNNQRYVAPSVNSVYATQMRRVNEIPLYGKNKNMYFYNQKKRDEGDFHDSGLYLFASYSTGKNNKGINAEKSVWDADGVVYMGGSDSNTDMGTANGFTIGVGREMSKTLSAEFMFSSYTGMKYGDSAKVLVELEDDEGNIYEEVDSTSYEVVDGGKITSNFIGVGLRYNLDRFLGSFGGRLKPYFGVQVGLAQNTIDDFTITDPTGYTSGDIAPADLTQDDFTDSSEGLSVGTTYESTSVYDGELTTIGATIKSFGLGLEAGLTISLEGSLSLDIFYKMNRFGKVETSGNILSVYNEDSVSYYLPDNYNTATSTDEVSCDSGFTATALTFGETPYFICQTGISTTENVQTLTSRQKETGDMLFQQYGVKLKYMF